MRKGVVLLAVLIGASGGIGWMAYERMQSSTSSGSGGGWGGRGGNRGGGAVAVEVMPVQRRTMQDLVTLTGTLEPQTRFLVAPKVSGRLDSLLVNMGDAVTNGQLVAKLDDAEAVQQIRQAEAALKTAQSSLEASREAVEQAERDLRRIRDLSSRGLAPQNQLESAQSQLATREANLRMAQSILNERRSSLEAARIREAYSDIRVSWDSGGETRVVGERFVDPGTLLNSNTPLLSILDLSTLTAVVTVTEVDYFKLQPGQKAEVVVEALPDQRFAGEIVRIAPFLQETSREARVEVAVPNPEALLKPGMFVRVAVELERRESALVIPQAALVNRKGPGVFVADRETNLATFTPIQMGITDNDWIEVRSPELSGDVVTLGQHLLKDGAALLIAEPGKAAAPRGRERPGKPADGDSPSGPGKRPAQGAQSEKAPSGRPASTEAPQVAERTSGRSSAAQ